MGGGVNEETSQRQGLLLARNVFSFARSKKYHRHMFIAGPYTHLSKHKENWRSRQQTRETSISLHSQFGHWKDSSLYPGTLEPGDSLGRALLWALDWYFKLGRFLIAESDLKILGIVPDVFQKSTPARKGDLA